MSYVEANAVWCGNKVQARPRVVSFRYSFQSLPTSGTLSMKGRSRSRKNPLREIREETAKDPVLQSLKQWFWMDGPTKEKDYLLSCANISSWEMSWLLKNVFFFKGLKSVIPMSLRPKIKEKLHRSHIGIQGCLRGARELSIGLTWTENWENLSQSVKLTTPSSLFNRKSL